MTGTFYIFFLKPKHRKTFKKRTWDFLAFKISIIRISTSTFFKFHNFDMHVQKKQKLIFYTLKEIVCYVKEI